MSWYNGSNLSTPQINYLKGLQKVFQVQNANRKWVRYKLTPHQIEWHKGDITLLGSRAKNRCVVKSRNTSFTTSAIISNISAIHYYPQQVVPFVRLNITRANDLIDECKKIINHMKFTKNKDGVYYPFNPDEVEMKAKSSIKFPNGVEFRAFPATNSASEVIRGLRISGSAGIIDESNFMKDYENIYIALRDASAGSEAGVKHFQMNIGTTLKGRTSPFKLWFDKQEKIKNGGVDIYRWPVFPIKKFNIDQPITEQELTPIVPWHDLNDLEQKRVENKNRFLEEYMAQTVDNDDAFYEYDLIMKCINEELESGVGINPQGMFFMGVDVASVHDYFVITVFEKIGERFIQRYLWYSNDILLPEAQKKVDKIIQRFNPIKCRIDSDGMGLQIAQAMIVKYGKKIDAIKGAQKTKAMEKRQNVKLKEYVHSNQKMVMLNDNLELINDELQIIHYSMWTYEYKAESNEEQGHGDIAIANAYALLPVNYRLMKSIRPISTNINKQIYDDVKEVKREVDWGG